MQNKALPFLIFFLCFSGLAGAQKPKGPPPASVVLSDTRIDEFQDSISLNGTLIQPRESLVSSEEEGIIDIIRPLEGDRVFGGAKIIRLRNSRLRILMEEAISNVSEAEKRLKELRANLKKAENDFKINKNLFRERIINEQVLTNSRLEVEAAKEGIAQAEFSIISKKTKVDFLKDRIDKLTITAPFSGVVVEKFVEKGEWIKQGQQLLRVMETNPLWVEVPVPEEIITRINEGVKAEVHVNMAEGTTFWAKVFRIIPKADTITRTFPVRLLIENPKGVLKVGMTARVSLPHGKKKKALMIPRDAVTTKLDKKIVFALAENATVKMFTVKTGATREGWVEVLSEGLTEKDQVVVRGGERLRPGQAVRIVKAGK